MVTVKHNSPLLADNPLVVALVKIVNNAHGVRAISVVGSGTPPAPDTMRVRIANDPDPHFRN